MTQRLNTAEMAAVIAHSARHAGGYLYPGTIWEAPSLSQTRRWTKSVYANIGALSTLPIGAVLTKRTRFSDNEEVAQWKEVAQWLKTGPDGFELIGDDAVIIAIRYSRPYTDDPAAYGGFVFRFQVDTGGLVSHLEPCACEYRHAGKVRGECFDALQVADKSTLDEFIRLGWLDDWV